MLTRTEWGGALAERCNEAMRLSRAFGENSDSLANYSAEDRREMGDIFAVASGVVLLCRSMAVERSYHPATIRMYDGFFSVFSRYAFKCMLLSGAYGTMDEVQSWCNQLTTGIAQRFQLYDVDPFRVFDAAITLKRRNRTKFRVRKVSMYLRDFLDLFREQRVTE